MLFVHVSVSFYNNFNNVDIDMSGDRNAYQGLLQRYVLNQCCVGYLVMCLDDSTFFYVFILAIYLMYFGWESLIELNNVEKNSI